MSERLTPVWRSNARVGVPVGCAGSEWTGHRQSKQWLLSLTCVSSVCRRSQPPPGLPDWLIKPGYKHMASHHTLANLMSNPGIVSTGSADRHTFMQMRLLWICLLGHDGEETTTVFHTSVVPEVAEVHVAHTQDGQDFELSHSIEAES